MSIPSFRTRNPRRDADSDRARFRRLADLIETLIGEIAAERDGLRARHRQVSDDAAFSLLALEDGGGAEISGRVERLTEAMMAASARLACLEAQAALLGHLRGQVPSFGPGAAGIRRKT